jgi:hypothetical protein
MTLQNEPSVKAEINILQLFISTQKEMGICKTKSNNKSKNISMF